MLALAAERKDHVSTRPEDLACGGSGSVGTCQRGFSKSYSMSSEFSLHIAAQADILSCWGITAPFCVVSVLEEYVR